MKIDKRIFCLVMVLMIVAIAIAFTNQQKKINHLASQLNDLDTKTNQSGLAAQVALQQSTEIVQAIEASQNNEQLNAEWENRTPIGFKFNSEKG
jgi:predicted PurR-regulated permease PerM